MKFKVNLGRDKREARRPFPGIRDNELNSSTIPPKTGRVVTLVLLIAISPSDGDVKPGGPLGAFREEQAMSQHRVSPSPFLSPSSSHTTQLHYTNSYTYSHPNLNFLQYTIQILVPHVMWSAQAVHHSKIDHTQCHLSALHGVRSA